MFHREIKKQNRKSILVVDDFEPMRELVELILSEGGFEVVQAKDGMDALETLERIRKPSCIILNLHMPRLSGYKVYSNLKKSTRFFDIPIVLNSGHPYVEDIAEALGVAGYIPRFAESFSETFTKIITVAASQQDTGVRPFPETV